MRVPGLLVAALVALFFAHTVRAQDTPPQTPSSETPSNETPSNETPSNETPPSETPPVSDEDRGLQLYREAKLLYDSGEYKTALETFRQVDALLKSPNARLYIARCLRELDRLPEAFEEMTAAAQLAAAKAETDDHYLRTRDAAAAEREAMIGRIGRIVVAVADPPDGLEVIIAGRKLRQGELDRPIAVDPGRVRIRAEAPDHKPYSVNFDIEAGALETVPVTLSAIRDDTVVETTGGLGWQIGGFVGLGVGAAGMAVFAVTGLMANSSFAQLEDECGNAACTDASYNDIIDEGQTLDTVANVGVIVGAVGLAAGAAMLIFGWPRDVEVGAAGLRYRF